MLRERKEKKQKIAHIISIYCKPSTLTLFKGERSIPSISCLPRQVPMYGDQYSEKEQQDGERRSTESSSIYVIMYHESRRRVPKKFGEVLRSTKPVNRGTLQKRDSEDIH